MYVRARARVCVRRNSQGAINLQRYIAPCCSRARYATRKTLTLLRRDNTRQAISFPFLRRTLSFVALALLFLFFYVSETAVIPAGITGILRRKHEVHEGINNIITLTLEYYLYF